MKKVILLILLAVCYRSYSQQIQSNDFLTQDFRFERKSKSFLSNDTAFLFTRSGRKELRKLQRQAYKDSLRVHPIDLPVFGVSGFGNLNQEAFEAINGSGKISIYARPLQYMNKSLTAYASFNVNASNSDSLLFSTLIFPEIGNSSFLGTLEWTSYRSKPGGIGHSLAPFFEFSYKNIRTDSALGKEQNLHFAVLNYTVGVKYVFSFLQKTKKDSTEEVTEANFFATPFISAMNIPNEDVKDYQALLAMGKGINPATIKDNIFTIGIKVGFQVKKFGIFADFRNVIASHMPEEMRELKGFQTNIGFIVYTDIFELKKRKTD